MGIRREPPASSRAVMHKRSESVAGPEYCGWANGNIAEPVSCYHPGGPTFGPTQCAVINTQYVGCCKTASGRPLNCNYFTTCYPASAYDPESAKKNRALICTNSYSTTVPVRITTISGGRTNTITTIKSTQAAYDQCVTYLYRHGDQSTATSYDCYSVAQTVIMEANIPDEIKAPLATVSVGAGGEVVLDGALSVPMTNGRSRSMLPTASTTSPAPSTTDGRESSPTPSETGSLNGGIIAGIVIVSLVALAASLVGLWLWLRIQRRKNGSQQRTQAGPDTTDENATDSATGLSTGMNRQPSSPPSYPETLAEQLPSREDWRDDPKRLDTSQAAGEQSGPEMMEARLRRGLSITSSQTYFP